MLVLEPGPGMGFFTLELARLVGPAGRVVAVDVQNRMLASLRRRLSKTGLLDRVEVRLAKPDSLGVADLAARVDLVVAIAMVHELPSAELFFREAAQALKPGAGLLLIEPSGHVTADDFAAELQFAAAAGLTVESRPVFRSSHAAWLEKREN